MKEVLMGKDSDRSVEWMNGNGICTCADVVGQKV